MGRKMEWIRRKLVRRRMMKWWGRQLWKGHAGLNLLEVVHQKLLRPNNGDHVAEREKNPLGYVDEAHRALREEISARARNSNEGEVGDHVSLFPEKMVANWREGGGVEGQRAQPMLGRSDCLVTSDPWLNFYSDIEMDQSLTIDTKLLYVSSLIKSSGHSVVYRGRVHIEAKRTFFDNPSIWFVVVQLGPKLCGKLKTALARDRLAYALMCIEFSVEEDLKDQFMIEDEQGNVFAQTVRLVGVENASTDANCMNLTVRSCANGSAAAAEKASEIAGRERPKNSNGKNRQSGINNLHGSNLFLALIEEACFGDELEEGEIEKGGD
ncbi:hypothetical protein NE237_019262 [Protea cynaroides]|uniref:Uncharacterized protein n=1 Tax=Protea cynaroides TaxID=273540 RepID=A0A9Q0KBD2_9MAGN|nr:hypothetical protein NE237_019262 [Protea cynaroides]